MSEFSSHRKRRAPRQVKSGTDHLLQDLNALLDEGSDPTGKDSEAFNALGEKPSGLKSLMDSIEANIAVAGITDVFHSQVAIIFVTNRKYTLHNETPTFLVELDDVTYWQVSVQGSTVKFQGKLDSFPTLKAGDTFLYVHGYNNTVDDVALAAAKVGSGVGAANILCFCWPSYASRLRYAGDVAMAMASKDDIVDLVYDIHAHRQAPSDKLNIISHSLGNRLSLYAFAMVVIANEEQLPDLFGHLFFAAADVDHDIYVRIMDQVAPQAKSVTSYACNSDSALLASSVYNVNYRGGRYPDVYHSKIVPPTFTTLLWQGTNHIDNWGHTYFQEQKVIEDMRYCIEEDKATRVSKWYAVVTSKDTPQSPEYYVTHDVHYIHR